ncbi:hypothetical protein Rcae01_04851 [Novipirellula caenicola]|uniref:Uncharacterized protein n=1 Tax=Novipirellula caenicola TaxID=1536901 RepID=A0ABP9VW32_9BACT
MHRSARDEMLQPEEYRKMGDRKMKMLHRGADHFPVLHLPVNPPLLD